MILIKTQRDTLLQPLQSVSGIVERRHTLPILSNVLLERKAGCLTFLATDIEIQVTTAMTDAGEGNDGATTVGARKLQDILRLLPENAEVSLALEEHKLVVKSGKIRFSLQTLAANDFPRMTISEGETRELNVTQGDFKKLLAKTQFSMAAQDVRYYLNGLLLLLEGKELRAVATDGHRLAYACMAISEEHPRQEAILPRKTVLELNRLLMDNDEPLNICFTANQVRFTFGSIVLVSKLIDGKFPDYQRVVPASLQHHLIFDRQVLMQSMVRAAILTNEKFRGVRIVIGNNSLRIVVANAEQEEAQEEMEVAYQGDELDIGFNVSYLLDVLNNIHTPNVQWSFNDASSSALISIPDDNSFKYVVMPMRI
ncbi:MAG: polymerase subunit beta [Proteobacteria bacterium]|nr:polymerase subunit beta [Pseudomonadota bacterium]